MMQELKHDLYEHNNCQVSNYSRQIYQLPHEAFSVSNQIAINETVFNSAMNIKDRTKNTSVQMKKRSVSHSHTSMLGSDY